MQARHMGCVTGQQTDEAINLARRCGGTDFNPAPREGADINLLAVTVSVGMGMGLRRSSAVASPTP